MTGNIFTSIPPNLFYLPNLQYLYVARTHRIYHFYMLLDEKLTTNVYVSSQQVFQGQQHYEPHG